MTTGRPSMPASAATAITSSAHCSSVVDLPVPAVAVAGEVDRSNPELIGERRGHVRPPVGVGAAAVHEDEPAAPRLAPVQVVHRAAVDLDRRRGRAGTATAARNHVGRVGKDGGDRHQARPKRRRRCRRATRR